MKGANSVRENRVFAPIHVQLGHKFVNWLSNVKEVNTYVLEIKACFNSMYRGKTIEIR